MLKTDIATLQLIPFSTVAYYPEKRDEWWESSSLDRSSLGLLDPESSQSTVVYEPITTPESSTVPDKSLSVLKTDMATLPLISTDSNLSSSSNSIQVDQMQKKFRSLAVQYYGQIPSISLTMASK